MSQQFTCLQQKSWIRGLNSSADLFDIPKGAFPRGSNLILSKRGALKACDGTAIVNAFGGVPTPGRGRIMAAALFQPIGVNPYYLLIAKALDQPLGAPYNPAGVAGSGGTLAAGTYYYVITAIDGAGGETTPSPEITVVVGASGKVTLTWNEVPNAAGYNIYRGIISGAEELLSGSGLPATSNTFVDTGLPAAPVTLAIAASPNGLMAPIPSQVYLTLAAPSTSAIAFAGLLSISGASPSSFNGSMTYRVQQPYPVGTLTIRLNNPNSVPGGTSGGGGTATLALGPPSVDTTQQTALYAMSAGIGGIPYYNNSNIVALWPADIPPIDGFPGGGSGGGGTGGSGGGASGGGQGSTPGSSVSGGVDGNVGLIPQMIQFVNQMAIALGNGYPPQLYSDPNGTTDNPAKSVNIASISGDVFGVVTIQTATPHGLATTQIGANVLISGVPIANYNSNGTGAHAFVVLTIPDGSHLTVRNLIAASAGTATSGTLTVSTQPVTSTFTAAYPTWAANTTFLVGDIVQPPSPNGFYYVYTQAGISGATAPAFPTGVGQEVPDGYAILKNAGQTISGSPPPPGAAHIAVFAGSLWVWNTASTNTSNGLDGPTCLRMSDSNNPNSWNPINQAFLDKDDGTQGMGLASFTITAQGIPPEGSLVACKDFATYQILGVFGAQNFAIQRIKSDMGAIAPRTLQFIPGFGIGRYSHLGFAVFDGVDDKLISEDIRPYLFPTNDQEYSDITVVDANWVGISWAAQVTNPPMYAVAMPIGSSAGALTRIFCYDLVLKAWTAPIDLPFPISCMYQARTEPSNPLTLLGSFSDGTFQRWQASDLDWATSASGSQVGAPVSGFVVSPEVYNQFPGAPKTGPVFYYQVIARGRAASPNETPVLSMLLNLQEEGFVPAFTHQFNFGVQGSFEIVGAINETIINARLQLNFVGAVEIDSFDWFVSPKPSSLPVKVT